MCCIIYHLIFLRRVTMLLFSSKRVFGLSVGCWTAALAALDFCLCFIDLLLLLHSITAFATLRYCVCCCSTGCSVLESPTRTLTQAADHTQVHMWLLACVPSRLIELVNGIGCLGIRPDWIGLVGFTPPLLHLLLAHL